MIKKQFLGIKSDQNNSWNHFLWRIEFRDTVIDWRTGLGHCEVARKKPAANYARLDLTDAEKSLITKRHLSFSESIYVKIPSFRDVIYGLALDAQSGNETFQDFCDNLGYDYDSRTHLETYLECQKATIKLRKLGYNLERILKWEL